MKNAYPIIMTQGKEFIVVFVPDFNINTQGKDIPDAIEMARDAIGLMGIDMQDDGEVLPEASSIANAQAEAPDGAIVSLVDVDFAEYRRKNDMRVVKKNCTIPSWLNFEAERAGVNFSAVLQAAFLPPFFSAEKNDPTMVRIEERRGGAFIMKSLYNNARNNATAICAIPHTELIKS